MMDWKKLLTAKRLGKKEPDPPEVARTTFQRDYDRLVFSSSFRRLKDKTQVFPLAQIDYVRTRLIHSMEVSCVGRSLGTLVGEQVISRHNLGADIKASDFSDIVFAACAAHDIGNPPFGHSGEDSIQSAFKTWRQNYLKSFILSNGEESDLNKFEGNAQGFRILTHLEMAHRFGGMRLNCPTLAAFTKYPRESYIPETILTPLDGKSTKKYGFFQAEKALFTEVAETVGLIRRDPQYAWWARHPLTFLVEAADDICYNIVDLEDGHRMGLIPFDEAEELLGDIAKPFSSLLESDSQPEKIKHLRALAINNLVQEAASNFLDREVNILNGKFDQDLLSQSNYLETLKEIQKITTQKVFQSSEVVRIQIAGLEIMSKLFEKIINAVFEPDSNRGKLMLNFLPSDFRPSILDSDYQKILKVTDYLAGMTDSYARDIFQEMYGISLIH